VDQCHAVGVAFCADVTLTLDLLVTLLTVKGPLLTVHTLVGCLSL